MLTRTTTLLLEGLKDLSGQAAWQEFDARYRPLLQAVARRLGLNPADADDAVQETLACFIVDYREGRYQRKLGRLRDWLAGIMTHKVRDLQRKQHREKTQSSEQPLLDPLADSSVESAMRQEWSDTILRQCLQEVRLEVTPQTFESFELYALKQHSPQEVAKRLGISVNVVYQNKRRVLQRMRELLPQIEELW